MNYMHGLSSVEVRRDACEGCCLNRGPHCRKETPSGLNVILQFVCASVEGRVNLMVSSG